MEQITIASWYRLNPADATRCSLMMCDQQWFDCFHLTSSICGLWVARVRVWSTMTIADMLDSEEPTTSM